MTSFSDLVGKTVQSLTGLAVGLDNVVFYCDDGSVMTMFHEQDCCEGVTIEDVSGKIEDLVGSPILFANEETNDASDEKQVYDSGTWTFYRIGTIEGSVVIRWLGQSNGYYSESVTCAWDKGPDTPLVKAEVEIDVVTDNDEREVVF